ncbi:hypothetical protein [Enemella evansiae]|uniref:hypothetical protein n=1 Tax=Enemella evansiae TaxID=2016499 RepID=UPI0011402D47|nr:hypothetical protein [Enemella evansiae]
MSRNPAARLFLDDGPDIVLAEEDRLRALVSVLPPGVRALPGRQLADRLDLLGHTAERARAALDAELEITNEALAGLPEQTGRRHTWALDPFGGLGTTADQWDAERWLQVFGSAHSAPLRRRLLGMVDQCPLLLLLRACLLARPDTRLRLIGAADRSPDPPPVRQVMVVGTARDALLLRTRMAAEHAHLSDLIRVVPVGSQQDEDDRDGVLALLDELGVGSAGAQLVGVDQDGTEPVDEPRE